MASVIMLYKYLLKPLHKLMLSHYTMRDGMHDVATALFACETYKLLLSTKARQSTIGGLNADVNGAPEVVS